MDEALADPPPFDWRRALRDGFAPPFQLSHHGVCNRRLKEKYSRLFASAFPRQRPQHRQRDRIRVGFTCTRGHEGGFLRGFGEIIRRMDRHRFEVVGLVSQSIVPLCRRGIRSTDVSWIGFPRHVERACQVIQQAECDVVLHWQAGTDMMNYFLPFLPLAPIQCIGFGNHGTTGISNIDYFISSQLFERGEEAEKDYTETLIQFAGSTAWQPRPSAPERATREDFGLPGSEAIYLCPQRMAKFQADFVHLLHRVLAEDATGHVIVLAGKRKRTAEAMRQLFQERMGKEVAGRILFLPKQNTRDYYRLLSVSDVVLDAPCYSASLTGYDAFSLGIPVVTWPGRYMVQRYALGLYTRMGIGDLAVSNEQEYVDLAVRLGRDADFRRAFRQQVRERSEVLYEDDRAVSEYERFFEQAVQSLPRRST